VQRQYTGTAGKVDNAQAAGVPDQRTFATKPELARMMLQRALEAGVPAGWVTADEVYGGSPALRGWLEARQLPYVLAVKRTEPLPSASGSPMPAARLAGRIPPHRWLRLSAGHGAKGCRWYAWSRLPLDSAGAPDGWERWLLVRRSLRTGGWRTTCAPARLACRWSPWSGSPGVAGGWRRRSRPARGCAAWTSTRSAAGAPGIGG
jgi:hypothetical protein